MTTLLIVGAATLFASFVCSLFEAALYAITPSQIELLKQRGVRGARRLARLRADVEEPIAAILTINTVAHTVGAAWCGAIVGSLYGNAAVGIFAAVFTLLVLTVTEIVPKSVGVRHARLLGPRIAWPLQFMVWLAWPIARPAKAVMRRLTGPARIGPTEEEVEVFSALAARHGQVRDEEHRWVSGVLRLDRFTAGDLRTPRVVVERLSADTLVTDAVADPSKWVHSRVPVTEGDDPDEVVGLVFRREVFDAALTRNEPVRLRDLMRPMPFVPVSLPAHELLDRFIRERCHIFALADEFGGFEGVVTLEDVLECMLGAEIVDEHDEVENMREMARRKGGPNGSDPEEGGEEGTSEAGTNRAS